MLNVAGSCPDHRARSFRALGLALAFSLLALPVVAGEFKAGYFEALAVMARGDLEGSVHRLVELERTAFGDGDLADAKRLREGEYRWVASLAASEPELLVPIIRFHEHAYAAHLERRHLLLAVNSRELVRELIELYVDRGNSPDAPSVASDQLASLAGLLQQASMPSMAGRFNKRALELDPRNIAALLGQATVLERRGQYESALGYLDDLLAIEPTHREARLRRGINLLRTERVDEGVVALEALTRESETDWLLSLAYQELARARANNGERGAARDLLEEAMRRLPEDPTLAVPLAYLQDRTGVAEAPLPLPQAMRAASSSPGSSPRSIYNRTASEALERLRVTVDQHSDDRLPQLSEALREPAR